jgi:hypothetical protein
MQKGDCNGRAADAMKLQVILREQVAISQTGPEISDLGILHGSSSAPLQIAREL